MKSSFEKLKGYTLFKGGIVYSPFNNINKKLDILLKDEKIIENKSDISNNDNYKKIDCNGKIITNGFLDIHTHFRSRFLKRKI